MRGYITGEHSVNPRVDFLHAGYLSQVLRGLNTKSPRRCMGSRCPRASRNPKSSLLLSSRPPQRQNRVLMTRTSLQNEVPYTPPNHQTIPIHPNSQLITSQPPQRLRSSVKNCTTGFPPSQWSCMPPRRSMRLREDSSSRTQSSNLGSSVESSSSLMKHSHPTLRGTGRRRAMLLVAANRASTSSMFVTGSRRKAFERVSRLALTGRAGL